VELKAEAIKKAEFSAVLEMTELNGLTNFCAQNIKSSAE
jgi:hypothetical protein